MKRWVWPTLLVLVLVVAAWLRLTHIDWDEYHHFHPDERYISWVATTIEWPDDLATGLTPNRSSFNPFYWPPDASGGGVGVFQDRPRDFAYGHLFLYLGVAASDLVNQIGPSLIPYLPDNWFLTTDILNARLQGPYEHITIVGRALAAIMDLGTIVLLYLLGKRLYHPAVGLLAGSFLALNVMHIQLSHFFTSDPFMTFFVVLALLGLVSAIDRRLSMTQRIIWLLVGAAAVGFAVGNKFSAVMLLLPLALTVWWMGAARKRQDGTDIELPGLSLSKRVLMLVLTGVIALVAFTVTNPFAVLDNTCSTDLGLIEFDRSNWKICRQDRAILRTSLRSSAWLAENQIYLLCASMPAHYPGCITWKCKSNGAWGRFWVYWRSWDWHGRSITLYVHCGKMTALPGAYP